VRNGRSARGIHRLTLGTTSKGNPGRYPLRQIYELASFLAALCPRHAGFSANGARLKRSAKSMPFEAAPRIHGTANLKNGASADFDPRCWTSLLKTGEGWWGPASPQNPPTARGIQDGKPAGYPTRGSAILLVREDADWMDSADAQPAKRKSLVLGAEPTAVMRFFAAGAVFFLWRYSWRRHEQKLKFGSETSTMEPCGGPRGCSPRDGFDNLRALIDPRRRSAKEAGRRLTSGGEQRGPMVGCIFRMRLSDPTSRRFEAHLGGGGVGGRMIARSLTESSSRELLTAEKTILSKWREALITLRRLENTVRFGWPIRSAASWEGRAVCFSVAVESLGGAPMAKQQAVG